MNPFKNIGGIRSILYSLNIGRKIGFLKLFKVLSSKNTCKTCALGMGGQNGGMRNEQGHWPEICKNQYKRLPQICKIQLIQSFSISIQLTILKNYHHSNLNNRGGLNFLYSLVQEIVTTIRLVGKMHSIRSRKN